MDTENMTTIEFPKRGNSKEAARLMDEINATGDEPLVLDASKTELLGQACAQLLIALGRSDRDIQLVATSTFSAQLEAAGITSLLPPVVENAIQGEAA
jgi:anti-anti-sigma regulatory factor